MDAEDEHRLDHRRPGAVYNIAEVHLDWERAFAVNFQIQTSLDGVNWVAIDAVSGNQSSGPENFSGLTGTGRYVRIYCAQTSEGSDNYSLYDFQVYGTRRRPGGRTARLCVVRGKLIQ